MMSKLPINVFVSSFLTQAREACQWNENHEVIAPGERTPYLDKAAFTACYLLVQAIPNAELLMVSCGARARPGKSTIPSRRTREWLVKIDDHLFCMEGSTSEIEAKQSTHKRWMLGGVDDQVGNFDIVVEIQDAKVRLPRSMTMDDAIIAGLRAKMEGPLTQEVVAPLLDMSTASPQGKPPRRRF